ncbi:MAG: peptidylprolyl isomerase [Bacteroidales bacterium]|nr:peptidylprolyl isomerase [Bacteroidales bacterium]
MHSRAQHDVVVDQVVAVVGSHIVKHSDIEQALAQVRVRQGYESANEARCQILESLLLSKLMVQRGEIDSVEVSDEEVEQQVEYYLRNYIRQFGTKEAMHKATGYTYDEMHDIYFDLLKERTLSQRVEYNITESVKITPFEVRQYFDKIPADSIPTISERYEIAEIELRPEVSEEERDRCRQELAKMRERVLGGDRFDMLATLYSNDPASAKKGGELGFFGRGDMVADFEAAAFALKPGEVSPIIETQYGFHILQLIERRGNTVNVRHILLTPKVGASDLLRARMLLDSIAQQIRAGNLSFAAAARTYSQADSKAQGGRATNPYTGSFRFGKEELSELYPGISFAAMKEGDVSNATPLKTDDGRDAYRIVMVTRSLPAHMANLTDDYDNIYQAALQDAKHKKVLQWARKAINTTYIRLNSDYQNCSFQLPWNK